MKNQQLIKSAHIWALTLLLACGLLAMAGKAGDLTQNQNQNSNSNSNSNTATQNQNSNTNTSAMGTQAGMASLSANDREFVMDAAMGGLMEVQLGRWAAQKGTSEAVKEFGKRMVDDHSQANTELMTLATSKGITLPTALDEKHQKEVAKITAMSGAGFDRAYSKKMLSDHKKDVSDFEKQSTRGTDPDIKAFAAKTLPTLQEHLQLVRTLPGNENAGGGGAGGERSTNRNMSDNSNMSGGNSNMNMNSNRNRNSNSNSNRNRNGNSNNSNRQ